MRGHGGWVGCKLCGVVMETIWVTKAWVDLLVRTEESGRRNPNNHYIEVMLQYYRKHHGCDKFKHDHIDSQWIDIDCVISTVTMSYILETKYTF